MFIVVRPKKDDLRPLSLYYCLITKLNLSVFAYKPISELNLERILKSQEFRPKVFLTPFTVPYMQYL